MIGDELQVSMSDDGRGKAKGAGSISESYAQ